MSLDLKDLTAVGPALPEPFVKLQLEALLNKEKLLPRAADLDEAWRFLRAKLRALGGEGGDRRVARHVLEPLAAPLGFSPPVAAPPVQTREGIEEGGLLFSSPNQAARLRAWAFPTGTDLDAPNRRGRAFRYSPAKVAARVLLASGERLGLLTDGEELRLLVCDPARPESHLHIRLDRAGGWRGSGQVPDSLRVLCALASPNGQPKLSDLLEAARLAQTTVTKKLRQQARQAIERFVQAVLDHSDNQSALAQQLHHDDPELAKSLWREGLVLVYRLLFILSLEAHADPARAFSFAATSLWRQTFSPNAALGALARRVLDEGKDTGRLLEDGLRQTFRMFVTGLSTPEIKVSPLGGVLFGAASTPLIDGLRWGEHAVAHLLDRLLWTDERGGRERVHYGALDVEELGRVYESLLELEPGIAPEPMARLRRAKLEVVVTADKAAPYRATAHALTPADDAEADDDEGDEETEHTDETEEADEEATPKKGKAKGKTKVEWIEDIPTGRFFLRVGLGRKSTGSYYTPDAFVRFLVHETLGPQLASISPKDDPHPLAILELKVLDPAMGSGHFLVAACRYLGEALYEACRACDDLAVLAEQAGDLVRARELRTRVEVLPDPNDELMAYLPSRIAESDPEGLDPQARGVSQQKALALCRRLTAVHCLYGVDKNPLAVELAKLAIWLESFSEGYPLTFMDHRLVCGDSLTGPFVTTLSKTPGTGKPFPPLLVGDLEARLKARLTSALSEVAQLEASVGKDLADIQVKEQAKSSLDGALEPFRLLARAWSGGVMLGAKVSDDTGFEALARAVADDLDTTTVIASRPDARLATMIATAEDALAFELAFPEVFFREGRRGFDAVLGNPPWDKPHAELQMLLGSFDLAALTIRNSVELAQAAKSIFSELPKAQDSWRQLESEAERMRRIVISMVRRVEAETGTRIGASHVDIYMAFAIRGHDLLRVDGAIGMVLSGGFAKNPAALPVRSLWIRYSQPIVFFQFDNQRRLFADLPPILEFCVAASRKHPGARERFRVGTELKRFEDLTSSGAQVAIVEMPSIGDGRLLTFAELASGDAPRFAGRASLWAFVQSHASHLVQEVYPSRAAITLIATIAPKFADPRLAEHKNWLISNGFLPVLEGRSIGQFEGLRETDHVRWNSVPTQVVGMLSLGRALERSRYFRLAVRRKVGSPKSNARSLTAAVIPPGLSTSDSLMVESSPEERPNSAALLSAAVLNAFPPDSLCRPSVQVMVTQKLLEAIDGPWVLTDSQERLLAHSSIRLHAETADYSALWKEQLGAHWREPKPRHTWPVLAGDAERWPVRAAIDAVVAHAYGLDRAQYAHILGTFSHKSYPPAPALCLNAFDELTAQGLDAFCVKYDPYHDVPLVTTLPKPVIDYPTLQPSPSAPATTTSTPSGTPGKRRPSAEASGQLQLLSALPGPLFASLDREPEPPEPDSEAPTPPRPAPEARQRGSSKPLDADLLAKLTTLLTERGTLTSSEAQASLGHDAKSLAPYFDHLLATGHATKTGQARGTRYHYAISRGES